MFFSPVNITVKCMEQDLDNEPRYNEILVKTNTIRKPKRKKKTRYNELLLTRDKR